MSWQEKNNFLEKLFIFSHFSQAVNFINQILPLAESINHHPDLLLYDYKKVKVMLRTHSQNKITQKDYQLAEKIDSLF